MRILVLGGTHFVGPHVVAGLVELGHDVTIFHSGETENPLSDCARHVHGRFGNFAEKLAQLLKLRPQVVVDVVPYHAKNGHESIDFDNRDVERAVLEAALPITILRMPAIFGPGDPFSRLYRYVKRMDDARPAILLDARVASWRWSRGYVQNVAQAVVLAATEDRAAGRTYNVAPLCAHTEEEWVRLIAEVHGWRGSVISVAPDDLPESMRSRLSMSQDIVLDSQRIRRELGYSETTPLRQALATTIDWEREHPPIGASFDYPSEDAFLASIT
ncbi:MAG: hypothetical protein H0V45_10295 [Actinobacteria bacterium]|nr:hypothetical protein [Actinomycetota bacterium]